jgi:lipoprotein
MKKNSNIPFVLSLVCVIGLVGCRSRRVVRTEQQYAAQHYKEQRDSVQQITTAAQRQAHHQWQRESPYKATTAARGASAGSNEHFGSAKSRPE